MQRTDYIRILLVSGSALFFWAILNFAPVVRVQDGGACSLNYLTCAAQGYPAVLANPVALFFVALVAPLFLAWLLNYAYLRRFYETQEWSQK